MRLVVKSGRCANANERGAGAIIHAVDKGESVWDLHTPALCGAKPTGRVGWTDLTGGGGVAPSDKWKDAEPTCDVCRRRVAELGGNKS